MRNYHKKNGFFLQSVYSIWHNSCAKKRKQLFLKGRFVWENLNMKIVNQAV